MTKTPMAAKRGHRPRLSHLYTLNREHNREATSVLKYIGIAWNIKLQTAEVCHHATVLILLCVYSRMWLVSSDICNATRRDCKSCTCSTSILVLLEALNTTEDLSAITFHQLMSECHSKCREVGSSLGSCSGGLVGLQWVGEDVWFVYSLTNMNCH